MVLPFLAACGIRDTQVANAYNATVPSYSQSDEVLAEENGEGSYALAIGYKKLTASEINQWRAKNPVLAQDSALHERTLAGELASTVTIKNQNYRVASAQCFATDRDSRFIASDTLLVQTLEPVTGTSGEIKSAILLTTKQNSYGCQDADFEANKASLAANAVLGGAMEFGAGVIGSVLEGFGNQLGSDIANSIFGN